MNKIAFMLREMMFAADGGVVGTGKVRLPLQRGLMVVLDLDGGNLTAARKGAVPSNLEWKIIVESAQAACKSTGRIFELKGDARPVSDGAWKGYSSDYTIGKQAVML